MTIFQKLQALDILIAKTTAVILDTYRSYYFETRFFKVYYLTATNIMLQFKLNRFSPWSLHGANDLIHTN